MTSTDPLRNLGVRIGPHGGELRVYSENADAMQFCLFDPKDPDWRVKSVEMHRDADNVWTGRSRSLHVGSLYAITVSGPPGPQNMFNPESLLMDPYAKGLTRVGPEEWRSTVVSDGFDWGTPASPAPHWITPSSTRRTCAASAGRTRTCRRSCAAPTRASRTSPRSAI
ncbi:hypothetical protein [Streptomyces sp. L7]|uniref:hypothetical protein n=1 Tax=Streptomyces sp. L7 TaxID=3423954 RepID=UPI003D985516